MDIAILVTMVVAFALAITAFDSKRNRLWIVVSMLEAVAVFLLVLEK